MNQVACMLDCRNLLCPLPLLKAKQQMSDLQQGQTLKVITNDATVVKDFFYWAEQMGYAITVDYTVDRQIVSLMKSRKKDS